MNDIEMLSEYENAVAMENADEQIKRSVKYVTKSNDNNGITYAIENILHLI